MEHLFRSLLFVPGHKAKMYDSAMATDADVLVIDIEDSVQPSRNKQPARDTAARMLAEGRMAGRVVYVRVNDRESGELLRDVTQLAVPGVSGFVYPKATCGQDVYFMGKLLETIEYERGLPVGTFKLIPLVETCGAVLNITDICAAAPDRLVGILFGAEDFMGDLDGEHDAEQWTLHTPRARIAMAAHAAGLAAIDTPHINVHDMEDLERHVKRAKRLGFEGMLCLHPKELPLVHAYYSPSEAEVSWAREMLSAARQAAEHGDGVAMVGGKFVGPPLVEKATKILARHQLVLESARRG